MNLFEWSSGWFCRDPHFDIRIKSFYQSKVMNNRNYEAYEQYHYYSSLTSANMYHPLVPSENRYL